jgi:iron(III) transport system substrate-binding protein
VTSDEVPTDHTAFIKLLATKPDKFKNKVVSWDIEKSGVGFLFATNDSKYLPAQDDLIRAFGAMNVRMFSATANMLERVAAGEQIIGYNLLVSYALSRAKKDTSLGVVIPTDYALVFSRVMFIGKQARHPNAARVWVDYILSRRGQTVIAEQAELYAIRDDVESEHSAGALKKQFGQTLKPIPVNSETTQFLDQKRRLAFLNHWKEVQKQGASGK